jgi:hypothetical protein
LRIMQTIRELFFCWISCDTLTNVVCYPWLKFPHVILKTVNLHLCKFTSLLLALFLRILFSFQGAVSAIDNEQLTIDNYQRT